MKNLLASLLLLTACSIAAQERVIDTGSFTKLSYGISGTLYLKQGSEDKVVVDAPEDVFDDIEIESRHGRLTIRNRRDSWGWRGGRSNIVIYVTMREIESVSASGSGSIKGENVIASDQLELTCSGSGSIDLEIEGDEVGLRVSGSGSIDVAGTGDYAMARISGSGRIRGRELRVRMLDATISGSGSIYMHVTDVIDGRISGSGSIYYDGNPDRVTSNSSGSGKLRKL